MKQKVKTTKKADTTIKILIQITLITTKNTMIKQKLMIIILTMKTTETRKMLKI